MPEEDQRWTSLDPVSWCSFHGIIWCERTRDSLGWISVSQGTTLPSYKTRTLLELFSLEFKSHRGCQFEKLQTSEFWPTEPFTIRDHIGVLRQYYSRHTRWRYVSSTQHEASTSEGVDISQSCVVSQSCEHAASGFDRAGPKPQPRPRHLLLVLRRRPRFEISLWSRWSILLSSPSVFA